MTKTKPGPTRSEKLATDLSRDIVEGTFPPGARLDEHTLARRYGMSRTPVREALKRLAGLDLVEVRPRRGVVVVNMTANRVGELFEALAEAEAVCARLAAIKRSDFELERLSAHHDAFLAVKEDGAPDVTAAVNRDFHETVYAGAHNASSPTTSWRCANGWLRSPRRSSGSRAGRRNRHASTRRS